MYLVILSSTKSPFETWVNYLPVSMPTLTLLPPNVCMSLQGALLGFPRRRGQYTCISKRKDTRSKTVSYDFKRLKILLGKIMEDDDLLEDKVGEFSHLLCTLLYGFPPPLKNGLLISGANNHMKKHQHLVFD